jgi:OOP family OmpA-OmpF porin
MRFWRAVVIAAALILVSAPAFAQDDEPGSKDHPAVPRMANYYIYDYKAADFDGYDFTVGSDKEQRVEGRYWLIHYSIKDGQKASSRLDITRNYRNAFAAKGGGARYEEPDGYTLTLVLKQPNGSELWCDVDVSNGGDDYTLTIIEKAAMTQQVALSAAELARALNETGSVALHNILFDTGKATIKPESADALKVVIDALAADTALKVEIQGHTDNVGTAAANKTLSQQRADAVRDYLIKTGSIAPARLTAVGFGDTKPVGPNTTEDGRAKNRRVELVKK